VVSLTPRPLYPRSPVSMEICRLSEDVGYRCRVTTCPILEDRSWTSKSKNVHTNMWAFLYDSVLSVSLADRSYPFDASHFTCKSQSLRLHCHCSTRKWTTGKCVLQFFVFTVDFNTTVLHHIAVVKCVSGCPKIIRDSGLVAEVGSSFLACALT
jgi:hypothetical protein